MPTNPPDTEFYKNVDNRRLWRDVSRLQEDWAPDDAPDRDLRFVEILDDYLSRFIEARNEE